MSERINTVWGVWVYDVWGNARDGYDVNDRFCIAREHSISLVVKTANAGTPQEFKHAYPSDKDIWEALGTSRVRLALEGDHTYIYASRERDGYPLGELLCTSHASLSPIREK